MLDALDHADAVDAAKAMADANGDAYRPFNLIVADNRDAFWVAHEGDAQVRVKPIEPGVHIISHNDLDTGLRAETHLTRGPAPACRTAAMEDPASWQAWVDLLSERADARRPSTGKPR